MIDKLKAKLRTKSFWVAVAGALTLLLARLGYSDAATLAENIAEGIGAVLLVFGIAVSPAADGKTADSETEEKSDGDGETSDDARKMQK